MDIVRVIEIVWSTSAFGLMAMVLLHSPKGDGIGGIGGQAQLFSSTKSAESNLGIVSNFYHAHDRPQCWLAVFSTFSSSLSSSSPSWQLEDLERSNAAKSKAT
jgi:preprotein translocase subunit SecG